ncbi:MAG TPA: dihydrofolate reductase family protein [Vicinamibacterales bacterium]|nr:dihydrofolate reductase family protein [Vicinamibacterales bacterium]
MESFREFSERKTREAISAPLVSLETIEDQSAAVATREIGNSWTRAHYDGPFHLPMHGTMSAAPFVSLVFVQSKDGNTATDSPDGLGGGPLDKHLIYEGLSRVAVDAVLAGAKTADDQNTFFSVWHPELVALRRELGLPRHPAQIVVTGRGCINPEVSRVFNVPDAPVYVLATPAGCRALEQGISGRSWVKVVPMTGDDLRQPLECLKREHGIGRISAVGGRTTASALLDQGLVQDICLTTTSREAGEPNTPFYIGRRPPRLTPMVRKRGLDAEYPIVFEHLAVQR